MITPGEKALKRAKNAILDRHERKSEHGAAILRAWSHNLCTESTILPQPQPQLVHQKYYFAPTTITTCAPKVLFCHNHNHNECTKSTCHRSNRWRRSAHNWATGPWGESPISCFVRNILFRLVCYKRLALLYKLDTRQLFALLHDHMSKQRSNCANNEHAKSDDFLKYFALAFFGIANLNC